MQNYKFRVPKTSLMRPIHITSWKDKAVRDVALPVLNWQMQVVINSRLMLHVLPLLLLLRAVRLDPLILRLSPLAGRSSRTCGMLMSAAQMNRPFTHLHTCIITTNR